MAKDDEHDFGYHYIKKKQKGTFSFTAPNAEGVYDFRMFEYKSWKGSGNNQI